MSNTDTVPSILPSMDYHRDMYDFYLDSVDSLKENVQYPNGYFYPSKSMQNSPQIPGVQLGNSYTHFEYPRPHLNQINWEQSQNIQDIVSYHRLNYFHPYNVQKRDSQVSPVEPLETQLAQLPPRPAPPRGDLFAFPCDPWGPAHAELLNARVAAALPLQPLSVKHPISSDYKNDQTEIKAPHEESLELLDLDSILASYQANEAEQPKSFSDLTQIGNQMQVLDQNFTNNPEVTSNWPYDLPAALQTPSAQPVYPAPSTLPQISSKTAPRRSNGARGLKTFNCTACKKWFTSSGHLKRHYSTTIHKNSVRTSGQPDPAAASVSPRRVRRPAGDAPRASPTPPATHAPHTLPPFSHLQGNPYMVGSLDTSGTAVPEPKYGPVFMGQNQQHMTPNHTNKTGPEVLDISGNNPTIAKPDPSGDTSPESGNVVEQGLSHHSADGRLPSFAQLPEQRFGTDSSNFFNKMDQQRDNSLAFKPVEEFVSICVPLNNYIMEEQTQQQLQMLKHEPATEPERAKADDASASRPPSAPAAPAPHECLACGKRFSRACSLTQHNNSSHSGARLFKCARCGKRFADEAARARHGARHVGRKPFGCDACPKSFNHKSDLRRHMCLHAAGKPYACALCGKGFVRRDHMLKHANTHAKRVTREPSSSSSSSSSQTPPSST